MQWNLMRIRKENNLTQVKMAEILNMDYSTYNKKENGKSKFDSDEMFLISCLFDKPMDEIFLPTNSNVVGIKLEEIKRD